MAKRNLKECDVDSGNQLTRLKSLAVLLASEIESAETKDIPGLSRQYRETLRDIREMEGGIDDGDEVGEVILRLRAGKP